MEAKIWNLCCSSEGIPREQLGERIEAIQSVIEGKWKAVESSGQKERCQTT
jgi:hypothetical protein